MVKILEPSLQMFDHTEQKSISEPAKDCKTSLSEHIELIDDCSNGVYSIK